ncbi:MAG: hypothetical protein AB7J28_00100 [Hyphomonadaceae bacterium]
MHRRFLLGGLAALALACAAPLAIAQPEPSETPATAQPAPPATPANPSAPAPATPAAPAAPPANPNPVQPTAPPERMAPGAEAPSPTGPTPQGCRTRMDVGEQCACLSDTSRIGTSTADPAGGRNICVRPD